MSKVAIIGVGQSTFVRSYPGSIRELAFEGFKEAMQDAQIATMDIGASVVCSAPEYDKQRSPAGVFAEYLGLNPQPTFYVESLCSSSSMGLRLAYSLIKPRTATTSCSPDFISEYANLRPMLLDEQRLST